MLLQLPALPQVPGTHGVVQATRPQLGTIVGNVYAAGTIRVALELPVGHRKRRITLFWALLTWAPQRSQSKAKS